MALFEEFAQSIGSHSARGAELGVQNFFMEIKEVMDRGWNARLPILLKHDAEAARLFNSPEVNKNPEIFYQKRDGMINQIMTQMNTMNYDGAGKLAMLMGSEAKFYLPPQMRAGGDGGGAGAALPRNQPTSLVKFMAENSFLNDSYNKAQSGMYEDAMLANKANKKALKIAEDADKFIGYSASGIIAGYTPEDLDNNPNNPGNLSEVEIREMALKMAVEDVTKTKNIQGLTYEAFDQWQTDPNNTSKRDEILLSAGYNLIALKSAQSKMINFRRAYQDAFSKAEEKKDKFGTPGFVKNVHANIRQAIKGGSMKISNTASSYANVKRDPTSAAYKESRELLKAYPGKIVKPDWQFALDTATAPIKGAAKFAGEGTAGILHRATGTEGMSDTFIKTGQDGSGVYYEINEKAMANPNPQVPPMSANAYMDIITSPDRTPEEKNRALTGLKIYYKEPVETDETGALQNIGKNKKFNVYENLGHMNFKKGTIRNAFLSSLNNLIGIPLAETETNLGVNFNPNNPWKPPAQAVPSYNYFNNNPYSSDLTKQVPNTPTASPTNKKY